MHIAIYKVNDEVDCMSSLHLMYFNNCHYTKYPVFIENTIFLCQKHDYQSKIGYELGSHKGSLTSTHLIGFLKENKSRILASIAC